MARAQRAKPDQHQGESRGRGLDPGKGHQTADQVEDGEETEAPDEEGSGGEAEEAEGEAEEENEEGGDT